MTSSQKYLHYLIDSAYLDSTRRIINWLSIRKCGSFWPDWWLLLSGTMAHFAPEYSSLFMSALAHFQVDVRS
jgi:hypothetical protein